MLEKWSEALGRRIKGWVFEPGGTLQNSYTSLLTLLKGELGAREEKWSPAAPLSPRVLGTCVAQRG